MSSELPDCNLVDVQKPQARLLNVTVSNSLVLRQVDNKDFSWSDFSSRVLCRALIGCKVGDLQVRRLDEQQSRSQRLSNRTAFSSLPLPKHPGSLRRRCSVKLWLGLRLTSSTRTAFDEIQNCLGASCMTCFSPYGAYLIRRIKQNLQAICKNTIQERGNHRNKITRTNMNGRKRAKIRLLTASSLPWPSVSLPRV